MFDNPIFFLILISVISAISDWLGKRRKAKRLAEDLEGSAEHESMSEAELAVEPEPPRRSLKEEKQQWEERLRRLLEGDESPHQSSPQPEASVYPEETPLGSEGGGAFSRESSFRQEPVSEERGSNDGQSQRLQKALQSRSKGDEPSVPAPALKVTRLGGGGRNKRVDIDFHSKTSIRKAIVAAVVLGSPKGSGEEADLLKI